MTVPTKAPAATGSTTDPLVDPLVKAFVWAALVSSLALQVLVWWAPGGTLGLFLASACALLATGPGIAVRLFPSSRALFTAVFPAISVSILLIVTLAQVLTGMWAPRLSAGIVGAIGLAFSGAWLRQHSAAADTASTAEVADVAVDKQRPKLNRADVLAMSAAIVALIGAVICWFVTVQRINLDAVGARGIIEVLPWQYFAAIGLVALAVAILLSRPISKTISIVVWIAGAVFATTMTVTVNVADGGAIMNTAYVHVGFAEAINARGALVLGTDARFSWPAFFTAVAVLADWAGEADTTGLAIGWPAVLMSLYLPAVFVITRSITGSTKTAQLAMFLFIAANWGQQDYFSPQSIALLFFLSITAVIFHEMATTSTVPQAPADASRLAKTTFALRRTPPLPDEWTSSKFLRVEAVLLLLTTALIVQHQLTPVALILMLFGWALTGRTRHRWLWLGATIVFITWFAFGAYDWWTGHLQILIDGLGKPSQALSSGVSSRVRGNPDYAKLQMLRIAWSGFFGLCGLLGWFLVSSRVSRATTAIAVVAPASLVLGQSYGGEVVLRVFLYASPILAALTAAALVDIARRIRLSATAFAAVGLLLIVGASGIIGTTARGVNVAFERTPSDVLQASRNLLAIAPSGATIRPLATEGALRIGRLNELRHPDSVVAPEDEEQPSPLEALLIQDPEYVFLTSTRENYEWIINGAPRDWYGQIAQQLVDTGRYKIIWTSDHVTVLAKLNAAGRPLAEDTGVPPVQVPPAIEPEQPEQADQPDQPDQQVQPEQPNQ